MYKKYLKLVNIADNLKDIPLLLIRLILARGFYEPAMIKMKNLDSVVEWFEGMNFPFPHICAYLTGITELLGFILLAIGLGTRLISIPLIIVMLVAIFTVHISNGFAAGDNGYEIPLYYGIMLFTLLIYGPGRLSADYLIFRALNRK